MRGCGALALASFASGLLGCATVDVEQVPPCGAPESLQPDRILHRRVGSFWPHLYLRSPDSRAPVSDTATECGRKHLAFEALSACILSEGFQLLRVEDYEVAVQP